MDWSAWLNFENNCYIDVLTHKKTSKLLFKAVYARKSIGFQETGFPEQLSAEQLSVCNGNSKIDEI